MKSRLAVMLAALLLCAASAVAQDGELTGKIHLNGGETLEGVIEVAEFGVVEGAGIGTDRSPTNEYLSVQVDGEQARVPVEDIALIEADWQRAGLEGAEKWHIESLTITRKDGTKVTGKPHWLLHETTVRVRTADGTISRAHAFPVASADFDPAKLLVRIELGEAAAVGGTETPTETTETPTETTETPTETTETPTEGTATPAEDVETGTGGVGATVGVPSTLTLTVICPKCGEKLTIEVTVGAKTGD